MPDYVRSYSGDRLDPKDGESTCGCRETAQGNLGEDHILKQGSETGSVHIPDSVVMSLQIEHASREQLLHEATLRLATLARQCNHSSTP